ncbi:MAG: flagellar assembly protein FliW [Deltaproteobacteria bacterium]|nr:flagellar assembly protein FliW [Deltaproteobacteria bacterium]
MKLRTTRFGEIEVADDKIINFPEGLLGFADKKRYTILSGDEDSLFKWLQCIDDGALAFITIEPDIFMEKYSLDLSDTDVAALSIETPSDVHIITLVTVPADPSKLSSNLQGPIVINHRKKLGKQVISTHPDHKLRYFLMNNDKEEEC